MGCRATKEVNQRVKTVTSHQSQQRITHEDIELDIKEDYVFTKLSPMISNLIFKKANRPYMKLATSKNKTKQLIAKEFSLSKLAPPEQELLIQIANQLSHLDHINIVPVSRTYLCKQQLFLLYDYYPDGTLLQQLDRIPKMTFHEIIGIFMQVVAGLIYLQHNKIHHKTINLRSIILQDHLVKLVDFGITDDYKKTCQGWVEEVSIQDMAFQSPEELKGSRCSKSDVWSCGCLLYFMITSYMPFQAQNKISLVQQIKKGYVEYEISEWGKVRDLVTIMRKMIEPDIEKRITLQNVLSQPYFQKTHHLNFKPNLAFQSNMQRFKKLSKIQTAAIQYIITNILSVEDQQKILDEFRKIDSNGDGYLSREELMQAYSNSLDEDHAESLLHETFKQVDANLDNKIDYKGIQIFKLEFLMASVDIKKMFSRQSIGKLFRAIDKDHSGFLTQEEMLKIFKELNVNPARLKVMMKKMDKNSDGKISLDEFLGILTNLNI